jgi:hypothetical protein
MVTTAVLVGEAQAWLPELVERTKKLTVNGGFEKGTDLCVVPGITLDGDELIRFIGVLSFLPRLKRG